MVSAVGQPQCTESNIAENLASFDGEVIISDDVSQDVAHPSLCCSDF